MYSVFDISEYCLSYCTKINQAVSNLQLQKILYYIQAAFLVEKGKPCFGEKISAWKYGPVVESVYYNYRGNIADDIYVAEYEGATINPEDIQLIQEICDAKSQYSAGALVSMTHEEKPWINTSQSCEIKLDLISDYFTENVDRLRM